MPIAVEMTQLNTRIEKELKHAGDAALKEAGYTPSQAIRALSAGYPDQKAGSKSNCCKYVAGFIFSLAES